MAFKEDQSHIQSANPAMNVDADKTQADCFSVSVERFDCRTLEFWAENWIGFVLSVLVSASVFSLFSRLGAGIMVGAACSVFWALFRIHRAGSMVFRFPRFAGVGRGVPLLAVLCLVSLISGPHCFLDSYSYRFPQMFFWLQEGHPWSVPFVDGRINQMPHVWPMLSAAFYLPFGERAVAIPNFIGFLFLAATFRNWANRVAGCPSVADAIATLFLSAPVFLVGAATNDNVVCCCSFLAISMHFASKPAATRRTVLLSAVSFALCCGIKPQCLALAPVWGTWFFFSPQHPWRTAKTPMVALAITILIICSPVPTLLVNRILWGSFMHPVVQVEESATDGRADGALIPNIAASATDLTPSEPSMDDSSGSSSNCGTGRRIHENFRGERSLFVLGFQLFSPPFNPFFRQMNSWIVHGSDPAARLLRRFRCSFAPLVIPEVASLELLVALAYCVGIAIAVVRKPNVAPAVAFVLALTIMAAAYTHGGTLGRSFTGFFLPLFPVAFLGLSTLPKIALNGSAALSVVVGVIVIVTNPARSMLPLRTMNRLLSGHPAAVSQLQAFEHYEKRQHAVRTLIESMPETTKAVGIVLSPNSPFGDIWLCRPGIRVVPYARVPSSADLSADEIDWMIVKSEDYGPTRRPSDSELTELGLHLEKTTNYTSFISKGPEPWHLLRITGTDK